MDNEGSFTGIYAVDLGIEALIKIPIAIFWYYDFKSIGENTAYIYGKKSPIFKVVENVFEFKFRDYLGNKKEEDESSNSNRPQ